MIYGCVCSGIGAATRAWKPLGWEAQFFSEIDRFPSAVLAHHYGSNMPGEPLAKNGIPNHGDFTQIGPEAGPVDLLVGGTPCQSFSVAGKRLGLDDPRGNLALEYLALARRLRARWIVWENVPGVLSSYSGSEQAAREVQEGPVGGEGNGIEDRDFAMFLSFVRECGYGFAYRVLDAQYVRVDGHARAVPQRRERVFLVGYLGDWRPAAAVLFEPEGMRGDSAPSRKAGQRVAPTIASRPTGGGGLGTDFDLDGGLITSTGSVAHCLNAGAMGRIDYETETMVAHPLTAGMAASANRMPHEQGALIAFNSREDPEVTWDRAGPLGSSSPQAQAIAFGFEDRARGDDGRGYDRPPHFTEGLGPTIGTVKPPAVATSWAVRRLTPKECERLQGFPDDFTNVPNRGKPAADGPRYKALGNSMAVNAMRWIGQRIDIMEKLIKAGRIAA